jgi:hypothetical protein
VAGIAGLCVLVGGCVTYPYTSSFGACDSRAGACYRACEAYADDGDYGACHADCEFEAEQCFDAAYGPYNYAGSPYGRSYISPWYGSYGTWYPDTGYALSFSVIKRYGRSYRYDRDRRYDGRRDGDRDRRGRDRGGRDGDRDGYRGPGSGGGSGDQGDRPRRRYDGPSGPGSGGQNLGAGGGGSGGSQGGSSGGQGGGQGGGQPPSGGAPPSPPQAAPPPPEPREAPPPRRGRNQEEPVRGGDRPVERSPD